MKYFLFAYGSLMCSHSCARTLGRNVDYKLAKLKNFKRIFNAVGQVHLDMDNKVNARFANIKRVIHENVCYGLTFEVTKEELDKLREREWLYELVDVSNSITPKSENVYAFIHENVENKEGIILKRYLNIMSEASEFFPDLKEQINNELNKLNEYEILEGSFISISGKY